MKGEFAKVLAVALASVLLGGAGGWVLYSTGVAGELEGPFIKGEDVKATAFNAALFLALLLIGAFLLLALVKYRASALKIIGFFAFALTAFTVSEVYLVALGFDANVASVLSLACAAISTLPLFLGPSTVCAVTAQVVVGSLTGAIIAAMVPPLSMIAMLLAAAAYDVYAVYWGPLKRLIQRVSSNDQGVSSRGRSALVPLAVDVGGLALGMGDVILYASLSSVALLTPNLDFFRLLLVVAAALLGVRLTLKLVEKKGYAPALPIPVLLSILVYQAYNLLAR